MDPWKVWPGVLPRAPNRWPQGTQVLRYIPCYRLHSLRPLFRHHNSPSRLHHHQYLCRMSRRHRRAHPRRGRRHLGHQFCGRRRRRHRRHHRRRRRYRDCRSLRCRPLLRRRPRLRQVSMAVPSRATRAVGCSTTRHTYFGACGRLKHGVRWRAADQRAGKCNEKDGSGSGSRVTISLTRWTAALSARAIGMRAITAALAW